MQLLQTRRITLTTWVLHHKRNLPSMSISPFYILDIISPTNITTPIFILCMQCGYLFCTSIVSSHHVMIFLIVLPLQIYFISCTHLGYPTLQHGLALRHFIFNQNHAIFFEDNHVLHLGTRLCLILFDQVRVMQF